MDHILVKTLVLVTLTCIAALAIFRRRDLLFLGLVLQLLTLRLAFDWMVIPDRIANDFGTLVREDAKRIGQHYQDKPLVYLDYESGSPTTWFYINSSRGAITPVAQAPLAPGMAFITSKYTTLPEGALIKDTLHIRHSDDKFVLVCEMPTAN